MRCHHNTCPKERDAPRKTKQRKLSKHVDCPAVIYCTVKSNRDAENRMTRYRLSWITHYFKTEVDIIPKRANLFNFEKNCWLLYLTGIFFTEIDFMKKIQPKCEFCPMSLFVFKTIIWQVENIINKIHIESYADFG